MALFEYLPWLFPSRRRSCSGLFWPIVADELWQAVRQPTRAVQAHLGEGVADVRLGGRERDRAGRVVCQARLRLVSSEKKGEKVVPGSDSGVIGRCCDCAVAVL